MTLTVRIGPFSVFFTNLNKAMGLRGHSHFATVDLFYRSGEIGFPSFAATHRDIQARLQEFFAAPFRDHTNEKLARGLFDAMRGFTSDEIKHPVGKQADIDNLRAVLHHAKTDIIWLQPLSQSSKASKLCQEAATENGWRVSFQMHKYVGIR